MNPVRCEWTLPDEAKRTAALDAIARDGRRHDTDLDILAASTVNKADRHALMVRRYPDLDAVTCHHGLLLSVRYVPAQYAFGVQPAGKLVTDRIAPAKWVALVATETGIIEMDPLMLTVKFSTP